MRKQVGLIEHTILDQVDAAAKRLGQTRRVYVERSLARTLADEPPFGMSVVARIESEPYETSKNEKPQVVAGRIHRPNCNCAICRASRAEGG